MDKPVEKVKAWHIVKFGDKSYSLLDIPPKDSEIVTIESEKLEKHLKLQDLGNDFSQLGLFLSISYCGVIGFTDLQSVVKDSQDQVVKLCSDSVRFLNDCKQATELALNCMKNAYGYLVEDLDDLAKKNLQKLAKISKKITEEAKKLSLRFEAQSEIVNEISKKTTSKENEMECKIKLAEGKIRELKSAEECTTEDINREDKSIKETCEKIIRTEMTESEIMMRKENIVKNKNERLDEALKQYNKDEAQKNLEYMKDIKMIEERLQKHLKEIEKQYKSDCAQTKTLQKQQLQLNEDKYNEEVKQIEKLFRKQQLDLEEQRKKDQQNHEKNEKDLINTTEQKFETHSKKLTDEHHTKEIACKNLIKDEYDKKIAQNDKTKTEKLESNQILHASELQRIESEYKEALTLNNNVFIQSIQKDCEALSLSTTPSQQTESYISKELDKKLSEIESEYQLTLSRIETDFNEAESNRNEELSRKLRNLKSEQDRDDRELQPILDKPTPDHAPSYNPGAFKNAKNWLFGKSKEDEKREQQDQQRRADIKAKQEHEALLKRNHSERMQNRSRQINDANDTCNREKTYNENSRRTKIKQAEERKEQNIKSAKSDATKKIENLSILNPKKEAASKIKNEADEKAITKKNSLLKKNNDSKQQADISAKNGQSQSNESALDKKIEQEKVAMSDIQKQLTQLNKFLKEIENNLQNEIRRIQSERMRKDELSNSNYEQGLDKIMGTKNSLTDDAKSKQDVASGKVINQCNALASDLEKTKRAAESSVQYDAQKQLTQAKKKYEEWVAAHIQQFNTNKISLTEQADSELALLGEQLKKVKEEEKELIRKEEEYQERRKMNVQKLAKAISEVQELNTQVSVDDKSSIALNASVNSLNHLKIIMTNVGEFWGKIDSFCSDLMESDVVVSLIDTNDKHKRNTYLNSVTFQSNALQFYGKWLALQGSADTASDKLAIAQQEVNHYSCYHPTKEEAKEWIEKKAKIFLSSISQPKK